MASLAELEPETDIEAAVDKDEFRLIHGAWQRDDYVFYVYPNYDIPPDTAQVFDTCIVDPQLPSRDFKGTFEIELYEGDGDRRPDVTLRNRRTRR